MRGALTAENEAADESQMENEALLSAVEAAEAALLTSTSTPDWRAEADGLNQDSGDSAEEGESMATRASVRARKIGRVEEMVLRHHLLIGRSPMSLAPHRNLAQRRTLVDHIGDCKE